MQKHMQFERLIHLLADTEQFAPQDSLSADVHRDEELDETALELVSAAGCIDFQSFLERYCQ
jgi:hypothetical protein